MKRPELRLVHAQSAPVRRQVDRPKPFAHEGGRGRWRSRRALVADRRALGPVEDHGVHVLCMFRLRSEMVGRWHCFVRDQFRNPTEAALEYEVSPQCAQNWWNGFNGPSPAVLVAAIRTRPDAFRQFFAEPLAGEGV